MNVDAVLDWYASEQRDLPWRSASATPWSVMVSEFMLQQTPVARVLPVYEGWMSRWPTPTALAAATTGDAVRAWGRLGYPRRALRLHAAATACVTQHGGEVPNTVDELRALPGVGDYTAAAIAAFAFRQRVAVLDTNVRRVHARVIDGQAFERPGAPPVGERARALELLPIDADEAATLSVAVMELGALVCKARTPECVACPLASSCAWRLAGQPEWTGPARKGQTYAGTDRQCRGAILALLREAHAPATSAAIATTWADDVQRARALDGLVADGLVQPLARSRYQLPS